MTEDSQRETGAEQSGDQRSGDRRGRDRRRTDRRAPPPVWRRPWALVAYGVVGAFAAVLLLDAVGDDPDEAGPTAADIVATEPGILSGEPDDTTPTAAPVDAGTPADYERLIAEGQGAHGRLVRTTLFCSTINSIALSDVDQVDASIAAVADTVRRVPAAECKWGEESEVRQEDFLLLVPPRLAEQFASAPVVQQGFISRRRVPAVIEWLGRSEALALRTAGVLEGISE